MKTRTGRTTRTLRAVCLLALACACYSPRAAFAQSDAAGAVSPAKKTGGTKTANPKKHAKAAASTSRVNSAPSTKAHPASHPPADKHPKSNAAVAAHNNKGKRSSSRKNSKRKTARGQQKIEPERAEAIQEALIREHYMNGEPAGTWNEASEAAMRRYQADHGWQSKTVPDSRALISLGLGPSKDHLLNPESAMTTGPDVSHAASVNASPQIPVSHSPEPGTHVSPAPAVPASPAPSSDPQ